MNRIKMIFGFSLILILVFNFSFAELSEKSTYGIKEEKIEKTKELPITNRTSGQPDSSEQVVAQHRSSSNSVVKYKLSTDVLDGVGGGASSNNYSMRIASGGQSGAVGNSEGTNFYAFQGYVTTATFLHGDDNGDGRISVSDVVYEINYLFKGGPPPKPPEVGDVNCDNRNTVADVVYKVNYLFKGGPKPCNL